MTLVLERVVRLLELRILEVDIQYTSNPHSDTSLGIFADTGHPAYARAGVTVKLVLDG
jgi:hypothetical protein